MKITCDREKLSSAFQIVSPVANARSPKEILQNVKLVVGPMTVTLMATDMENGIRILVDGVDRERAGEALLPVARVGMILRECRDEKIVICTDKFETIIETTSSNFKLPTANPNEYPNVEGFKEESYHEISARTLKEMIRRTVFAIDADSSRYALGGVLFEMTGGEVFAIGTDGRRLARQVGTGMSVGEHKTEPNHCIVPGRSLALVAKAISDLGDDDKVNVAARKSDIVIDTGRGSVTCRLVEGKFPNWKQVIPSRKTPTLVDLSVGPLASGIRQAAIVADVETHGLDFLFDENELVISAKTANLGASRVSVPITYDEPHSIEMKLDYRYLSDFLRMLDPESTCTANIASSSESMLLTTDDGYAYVVMPMALDRRPSAHHT
jgi:DNA polymerase III subunit beta